MRFVLLTFALFKLILIVLVTIHCSVSLVHLADDYASLLTISAEYKHGLGFPKVFYNKDHVK